MKKIPPWILTRLQQRTDLIGVLLYGSYSLGMNTETSDIDLMGILLGDTVPERELWVQDGLEVELNFLTAERWLSLAQVDHWLNFGLAHGKVLLDPHGIVAEGLKRLQTLPESYRGHSVELLDTYLNTTYRSLKAWRRGDELGARLHAGMGVMALIDALFRLAGKWAPYWDRLDGQWGCLDSLGLDTVPMQQEISTVVFDASVSAQKILYRRVSGWMRVHGHAEIFDAWDSDFHELLT